MSNFQKFSIMIVEDNVVLQESLTELLCMKGFGNVRAFRDAFRAMSFCKKAAPDLAVLDLEMPGLSGLDVLTELKSIHPSLPVVMMSSRSDRNILLKACASGANTFFHKPFDTEHFCHKIEELLQGVTFYGEDNKDKQRST